MISSRGAAGTSVPGGTLSPVSTPEQSPHRSGFVALVGRPNAGKTTLTNALVGEKVGIVSNRPQTTRHAIRGVVHRPGGPLVLVDTPGLHKPKSLLGKRPNDAVRDTRTDVDDLRVWVAHGPPAGACASRRACSASGSTTWSGTPCPTSTSSCSASRPTGPWAPATRSSLASCAR